MKRFSFVFMRLLLGLAVLIAGAGIIRPVSAAEEGAGNPDALRTGSIPAAWRYVETLGHTGSPYPPNIQGNHLNRPAGLFIQADGKVFVSEENGKRVWGFGGLNFSSPTTTPTASGINDPFWNPGDLTRNHDLTWVIDGHHLAILDNSGAIVQNFNNFTNTDPSLGWVNNYFQCANSLSFDPLSDLLYVAQNCGDNPVLVLKVETAAGAGYTPISLTLVDAFRQGNWYKQHIQAADLNDDGDSEIYISGDNGAVQCEQPGSLPGSWNCSPYASTSLHRTRGLTYSPGEHRLYAYDQTNGDWNQNGIRKCDYAGVCTDIVTNNDLRNTPNLTFNDTQDLALTASGDIYTTDASTSVIARLTISGGLSYTAVFGVLNQPFVTADGYLFNPVSVLTDAENNLYIVENNGRRILSFDASGIQRWIWGKAGQWSGDQASEICNPQGNMAIDPVGNLYVADRCSGRVAVLNKDTGTYLTSFSANSGPNNAFGFNGPAGVAISASGRMFIADPDNQRVQEFKYTPYAGWSYFSTIGIDLSGPNPSTGDGALMDPSGMALKSDLEIFIADRNYNRIQKCTRAAVTSTAWTCANLVGQPRVWGNSNYLLSSPETLALDPTGRLFVADNNNNRIQVYDSTNGTYLGSIATGDRGTENDQLVNPSGVALDSAGNVYVADSNNQRVQKFLPSVPSMEFLYQQGGTSNVSYRFGSHLYTGYGNRVYVYDLGANAAHPDKIGQSQAFPGSIRDIVAVANTAYVLTDMGNLEVLDISTPAAPRFIRELLVAGNGQALALDETASHLFVLQNGPSMLEKFNLADPSQPSLDGVRWLNGWAKDVVVVGGHAYIAVQQGANSVISINALDLNDNTEHTVLHTAQTASLGQNGALLYIADPGFGLYRLNTGNANPPDSLAMNPSPRSVHPLGAYVFVTTNNGGEIAAVNVSGTSMVKAGSKIITPWRETGNCLEVGPGPAGAPMVYMPSNKGLSTYQVNTTVSPLGFSRVSQENPDFSTGWQTQTIGSTLYSIDLGTFRIFDASDPSRPVLLNSLTAVADSGLSPFVVRVDGAKRILYILSWENPQKSIKPELRTYDITNPANLILLNSTYLHRGNSMLAVELVGSKVVAAITESGYFDTSVSPNVWHPGWLELFDVTNPMTITALPAAELFNGWVNDVAISGNYLFVTERNNNMKSPDGQKDNNGGGGGLRVYDLSGPLKTTAPSAPLEKAAFGQPNAESLAIQGSTVFETEQNQGLYGLTINPLTDPSTWSYQNLFWFNGETKDLHVASVDGKTYAWVANQDRVSLLDVSNPTPGAVKELDSYHVPFWTGGVNMFGAMPWLWFSGFSNGMSGWWAAPTLDGTISTPNASLSSSVDGVSYTFANENLRLWHTPVFQGNLPAAPAGWTKIQRAFINKSFDPQTELPVNLSSPYTLTISYDPTQLGLLTEGTLRLYEWNGTAWIVEPSMLNRVSHTLTAHPNHFSTWSVMGTTTHYTYLPNLRR